MKTFKILHAPLHGASATNEELKRALGRKGVVGIGFSEAYRHGEFLGNRLRWRALIGGTKRDARGRMVQRDVILLVRRRRKNIETGIRLACRASTPSKIAPERYITWTVDNIQGKPLAMIGFHPHAGVRNAWDSDRAKEYRRGMRRLEALVRLLRIRYGADLAVVVFGDLNYPDVHDERHWAPRQVFTRLKLGWTSRGLDWVAHSRALERVAAMTISRSQNGQDHPWIEVEFSFV